jgi:2-amino-4-hydroxy-6-hydroxymethyldihydropteridine diphosphokinase
MPEAYLSLGSNLGNRKQYITKAELLIKDAIGVILKKSSLYETEPWGFHHPLNFYNRVLLVKTEADPVQLMSQCLQIEKQMGRQRQHSKYEARTIDIDILFYGDRVIATTDLQIPHPYLHLRKFILEPLCELTSDFIHPIFKKSVSQMLAECVDKGIISKI